MKKMLLSFLALIICSCLFAQASELYSILREKRGKEEADAIANSVNEKIEQDVKNLH